MAEPDNGNAQRCGYAAIVGRPNVGKSTLLNRFLGQDLSITAPRPQTTRHQILGIKTVPRGQLVFIDTPGIHQDARRAINRTMNRVARAVLADVDCVLWVLDASRVTDEDHWVGESLRGADRPVLVVLNKVDRLADKSRLLALAAELQARYEPAGIFMVSALKDSGLEALERAVLEQLPFSQPFFDAETITDRSERFLAAEFVREQIARQTHDEVPYGTTVEIEAFETEGDLSRIRAVIWVEREGQKGILIGRGGTRLRSIGSRARERLEALFGRQVHLETWVKVKQGWSDDERSLRAFGYGE